MGPSKLEVLGALLRVLDSQARSLEAAKAERAARVPTAESVLGAVRAGARTWEDLHAHYPETRWPELAATLTHLQRQERLYRNRWLDFQLGRQNRP